MREPGFQLLEYESPSDEQATGGVHVADYGDRLVITGARPRPLKIMPVVLWGAFAAAQVGWTAYSTGRIRGGWRFGPGVVFFVLLSVGVWGLQGVYIWRTRRRWVTEITREGVSVTDPTTWSGSVWFPRWEIRCMNLVHGERGLDDLPTCALRLVFRRGWLPALHGGRERLILRGPAAQLREIGERVRQVLDGEEARGVE